MIYNLPEDYQNIFQVYIKRAKVKFLKKGNQQRAFTLVELIVAIIIWSLILSVLMSFIASTMNEITYSNKQTQVLEKINIFSTAINDYKWAFGEIDVLINNTGVGSDVLIMSNPEKTKWIILWVVSPENMLLEQTLGDYEKIYEKFIGVRQLTESDISNLDLDPSGVYDLQFNKDKLFRDLVIKDLQAQSYNSGAVIDINLDILINFKEWINGQNWESVTNDWIYTINMNF